MGFDIERFIGVVNEGLLCSICRDVLEEPLLAPCEHTFCSACIHTWLTHYNSCPEDRQRLWPSDLKPIFRYMKNDLDRLKMRCDNELEGCKEEVLLGNLQHHVKEECAFSKVLCPNKGCEEKVNRCELETHLIICDYQTATCTKGCGLQVNMNEISQHNCVAELKKTIEEQKIEYAKTLRDFKTEMESRLDSQRVHMVYKESSLQNQIDELKTQIEDLLREMKAIKAKELQRADEYNSVQHERKELLDWLKGLKYQDDLAEKYCGSCNKRYLYVRKEPLTSFGEHVEHLSPSPGSSDEDALLTSLRSARPKTRSLCPSTCTVSNLVPDFRNSPRASSEESCLNRASVEYWRRNTENASTSSVTSSWDPKSRVLPNST